MLIKLDTKEYDNGNNFSTTTHAFTAPKKGLYHFSAAAYSSVATDVLAGIGRTSTTFGNVIRRGSWSHYSGSYVVSSASADFPLDVGDTVVLTALSVGGTPTISKSLVNDMGTYLSGYLVYSI